MDIAKWTVRGVAGLVAPLLAGCVANPYVLHGNPYCPSGNMSGTGHTRKCVGTVAPDERQSFNDALLYANDVREDMGEKAREYAVLNNGGGAMLLGVAGLAAYRGFQGGHEANIAALTTGGAAFYGAQQYLYRKPRETIYWAGAGAVTCAIGMASKAKVGEQEATDLTARLVEQDGRRKAVAEGGDQLRSELRAAAGTCSAQSTWKKLETSSTELLAKTDAMDLRHQRIDNRIRRLRLAGRFAGANLINATDAILDVVNLQLAAEQPDPASLAQLVSRLKMPALEGAAAPAPEGGDKQAPGAAGAGATPPRPQKGMQEALNVCDQAKVQRTLGTLIESYAVLDEAYSSMESDLDLIVANVSPPGETSKSCVISRAQTLLPFDIALAQDGAQVLDQGGKLLVPITGGVPPFKAMLAGPLAKGSVSATAEAADDGGYRFRLEASEDVPPGTYAVIASDAAGVTRPFQVRIEPKAGGK
jgi:hypothetical protein